MSPTPAQPIAVQHHVTAADLVAQGLPRATAYRWHAAAVASGEYSVVGVERRTRQGAVRQVRALVMDAATLRAVCDTIAERCEMRAAA